MYTKPYEINITPVINEVVESFMHANKELMNTDKVE